jgi:ribosomal protein S27AE
MCHECPTCGKELTTQRGMRQHHTKVHDDPLPNRTCKGCGTEFYDGKARLTFCDNCNPNAGKHNGNWKDAQESATCRRCDTEFTYYPSDKPGVYCSDCVGKMEEFIGTPAYEIWEVERVERECEHCGVEFSMLKCNAVYGHGRFCSDECQNDWMSENWRGEDHPAWEGEDAGDSYVKDWRSARRKALTRDNHECQRCGDGRSEIGRNPDVHHIKPVEQFDDYNDAHTLDNLVTLCPSCHKKVESGSVPVPAFGE